MKKLILIVVATFMVASTFAQAPEKINYQAVARDLTGNPLINTPVNLTFELLQGSVTGAVAYSESQLDTTNQFGLFTSEIGVGAVISGSFPTIAWGSNTYYLRITVNGNVMPATQLLSVPYALHAKTATSGVPGADGINCWDTNGNGINDVSEDVNGDSFFNGLDCQGDSGMAGIGITWRGSTLPVIPNFNDAYYDTALGQSLIWDGAAWQQMTQDGVANNNDTSATNEIQLLSINATNDTIFLTSGGFVPLIGAADNDWQINGANMILDPGVTGNVGVGAAIPPHKLSVVSSDSIVASFRANNPNFGAILVSNINPSAPVGIIILSGSDTAIVGLDPIDKILVLDNSVADGHIALKADSSVVSYAEVIGNIANSQIMNQADTIFSIANTGNNVINVNLGSFYTDSLHVLGNNVFNAGYVLTNDGFGQAQWQPSAGGSSLWTPNGGNVIFNTGNVGVGTALPSTLLDVDGEIETDSLTVLNELYYTNNPDSNYVLMDDGTGIGRAVWRHPNFLGISSGAFNSNGGNTVLNNINDNVGVGTASPLAKLHVDNGSILNNWTNTNGLSPNVEILNTNGTSPSYTTGTLGAVSIVASPSGEDKIALQGIAGGAAGNKFGIRGVSSGLGSNYGVYATASGGSLNNAVNAVATASGAAQAMGIYATVQGTTTNNTYGVYGQNATSTTGLAYAGYFQNLNSTGTPYGVRADVNSSSNGNQYGVYTGMNAVAASANKYGFYANVSGGANNWAAYFAAGDVYIQDNLVIPTNAGQGKVLTSDAVGNAVWKGGEIAYEFYLANSQTVPGGVFGGAGNLVNFDTPLMDDGGNFDATFGVNQFTAPIAGVYHIEIGVIYDYSSAGPTEIVQLGIMKNGAATPIKINTVSIQPGEQTSGSISATLRLAAGDKLQVECISQSGSTVNILPSEASWFSGHIVYAY